MLVAALAALSSMSLALADGLPDLGETSQNELSPQMERKIGEEAMVDIRLHDST